MIQSLLGIFCLEFTTSLHVFSCVFMCFHVFRDDSRKFVKHYRDNWSVKTVNDSKDDAILLILYQDFVNVDFIRRFIYHMKTQ